jgi:hypothetical protein
VRIKTRVWEKKKFPRTSTEKNHHVQGKNEVLRIKKRVYEKKRFPKT